MTEPLPATIIYPDAFLAALPNGFDGALHWEYLNDVLRPIRGIHCADIDSAVEIRGLFFHIESSDNISKFDNPYNGQNRRTMAYLRTGLVVHLDIVGKTIPTAWRWRGCRHGKLFCDEWQFSEDGRAAIANGVSRWAQWADHRANRDFIALQAAWTFANLSARKRLIDEIVSTDNYLLDALGNFADTPLGRAAIQRVRTLL